MVRRTLVRDRRLEVGRDDPLRCPVDEDGDVRYEQVADHPADRTYGNWVRYFIRNDYEAPFDE